MRSSVDRIFLLFALIQLGLEYQSICLFLWPLNHSCAKPPADQPQQNKTPAEERTVGSDYAFNDSRKNPVDPDAIQTNLFDAYPDDPFTMARAYSMGIKYDDIAGCLQYKREFDSETNTSNLDMSELETCPHGLHFEEPNQTLSVVAFFRLACSRQYLTILLPASFALGLIAGILLTAHYLIKKVANCSNLEPPAVASAPAPASAGGTTWTGSRAQSTQKSQPTNLYYWFLVQIIAGLVIQIQTYSLGRFIAADHDDDDDEVASQQQPELYGQFVCSILLRSFIAASNITRIVFMWTHRRNQMASHELFTQNHRDFLIFSAIFISLRALYVPLALRLSSGWWQLNEWLAMNSFFFTVTVFVREALLRRERPQTKPEEGSAINQLVLETNVDEPTSALGSAEVPPCEFCSVNEYPISIVDNPYLPTTTQHIDEETRTASAWPTGARSHSLVAQRALPNRNLLIQLTLLTFCLSFNYFLFQMLPDHELLHSETIASRLRRKLSYAEEMDRHKRLDESPSYTLVEGVTTLPEKNQTGGLLLFHDPESFVNHSSRLRTGGFDFRSMNRASKSVGTMQDSWNPIELLWTTAKLYHWPLELFIFSLHLSFLSNFEAVYFKLSRLFVLIELGAKFLAFEWLAIGIVRRQNHILEWDWLQAVCMLLARLSSNLMLFNYINTMLKLNIRLTTNRLMLFVPSTVSAALALVVASCAPLLEWIDLAIIPVGLIVVNLSVLLLTRQIKERFRASLCPMIFEQPNRSSSAQRMVLREPTDG